MITVSVYISKSRLLSFLLLLFVLPCFAQKIVVVTANFTTLQEWERMPHFKLLLEHSKIALMNTATKGKLPSFAAYIPLAASTYLSGDPLMGMAFQKGETIEVEDAEDIFLRSRGKDTDQGKDTDAAIFHLGLQRLFSLRKNYIYPKTFGLLGTLLRQHGIHLAAIGNADANDINRAFTLIGVDRNGRIEAGAITKENILTSDPAFPFGKKMSLPLFRQAIHRIWEKSDLLLIELGDFVRFEEEFNWYTPQQFSRIQRVVFHQADTLLSATLQQLGDQDKLLFLVPSPPPWAKEKGNYLGFLLLFQKGSPPGLLVSATTKTPGLVANIDIPPTILSFFDIASPLSFLGSSISTKEHSIPFLYIHRFLKKEQTREKWGLAFLSFFLVLEGLGFLYLLLATVLGHAFLRWQILGCLLLFPLWILFFPLFREARYFLLATVLVFPIVFLVLTWLKEKNWILLFLYPLFLGWDLLHHSAWMRFSPLGFSVSLGARYYGIGNEYMGIFLFSTLLLFSFLRSSLPRFLLWGYSLSFLFLLGVNLGGTLTLGLSGLFFFLPQLKKNRHLALLLLLLILASLFFLPASHISRFFTLLTHHHPYLIGQTLLRKSATNFRLLQFSRWANFLWTMMGIGMLLWWQKRKEIMLLWRTPHLARTLQAILIASGLGFLLNDSGVVLAASGFFALNTLFFYHLKHADRV